VDNERIAAIQREQLVLASALDTLDALAPCAARPRGRQLPFQRGMYGSHGSDCLSNGGATEKAGGGLYFRKLRQIQSSFRRGGKLQGVVGERRLILRWTSVDQRRVDFSTGQTVELVENSHLRLPVRALP
jgi:hypothetical protein